MDSWMYYAAILLFIMVAVLIVKKVTSCMLKLSVFFVLLVALCVFYFLTR